VEAPRVDAVASFKRRPPTPRCGPEVRRRPVSTRRKPGSAANQDEIPPCRWRPQMVFDNRSIRFGQLPDDRRNTAAPARPGQFISTFHRSSRRHRRWHSAHARLRRMPFSTLGGRPAQPPRTRQGSPFGPAGPPGFRRTVNRTATFSVPLPPGGAGSPAGKRTPDRETRRGSMRWNGKDATTLGRDRLQRQARRRLRRA
jgi:hypothetical protein